MPVRANTPDPRFDPRKPVTVNGFWYKPLRSVLLDRLRKGPLESKDYREVARTRRSLHVQVARLRAIGFEIKSNPEHRRHTGDPVTYELVE